MLFYIISIFSAILAGVGMGGGSIYLLVIVILNIVEYKSAMIYNLIMFVVVGIFATLNNIKNKKIDKKIFFQIVFFCFIGSFVGTYFTRILKENDIKKYFYVFMLIIGIYEIISSLISFKKGKI